jgi:uncharacterized protein YdbL (DUF1318 family)
MALMIRPCLLAGAALLLGGCVAVTVNVNFPQDSIDGAAAAIEDRVRTPAPAAAPASVPAPGGRLGPALRSSRARPDSVVMQTWTSFAGPGVAHAESIRRDIRTRTPEVQALVESRKSRYPQLAAAMAAGCVGERSDGLVAARPARACPPDLESLLAAENHDRTRLFTTIVAQNGMPAADVARVHAGFARRNRERAPTGTWIQGEAGDWLRK